MCGTREVQHATGITCIDAVALCYRHASAAGVGRWLPWGGRAVGMLRQNMAGVAHAGTCQHLRGGGGDGGDGDGGAGGDGGDGGGDGGPAVGHTERHMCAI